MGVGWVYDIFCCKCVVYLPLAALAKAPSHSPQHLAYSATASTAAATATATATATSPAALRLHVVVSPLPSCGRVALLHSGCCCCPFATAAVHQRHPEGDGTAPDHGADPLDASRCGLLFPLADSCIMQRICNVVVVVVPNDIGVGNRRAKDYENGEGLQNGGDPHSHAHPVSNRQARDGNRHGAGPPWPGERVDVRPSALAPRLTPVQSVRRRARGVHVFHVPRYGTYVPTLVRREQSPTEHTVPRYAPENKRGSLHFRCTISACWRPPPPRKRAGGSGRATRSQRGRILMKMPPTVPLVPSFTQWQVNSAFLRLSSIRPFLK